MIVKENSGSRTTIQTRFIRNHLEDCTSPTFLTLVSFTATWSAFIIFPSSAWFLSTLVLFRVPVFLATIQQDQENSMACTRILYPELSYCHWNFCCYSSLAPQYQVRWYVLEDINHNFWAIFLFVLYPPLTRGKVHDHFIIQ